MATDNSGGILVFTMPDLPKKDGRHCRVYKNTVQANNHDNFAPKGNIVATVPPGTGVMIMASDEVEVFDNTIENNQTAGLSIVSYLIADKPIKDEKYDPFCESIHIHDNRFKANGEKPSGALGQLVSKVVGSPLAGYPLRRHGQSAEAVRRRTAAGAGHPHPRQRRCRFRQFRSRRARPRAGSAGKQPKIVRDLKPYCRRVAGLGPCRSRE